MGTSHISSNVIMAGTLEVTGATTFTGAQAAPTSLAIGGGTAITKVVRGTVAVDPASLLTVAAADTSITITGAAVGDTVILNPPTAGLTAGLLICGAWVSATNTVKVRLYNSTGSTIDEASASWTYTLIRS